MKKFLIALFIMTLMITGAFSLVCSANDDADGFVWFADESNYSDHYYGGFQGVEVVSEDSVRILAGTSSTSNGHIGFMFKKAAIEDMVSKGFTTVSFKITGEAMKNAAQLKEFSSLYCKIDVVSP